MPKKFKIVKSTLLIATIFTAQVQADNLLEQCDWIDRKWVIHEDKKNWKINWFPEIKCVREIELIQKRKEVEQKEKEIVRGEEVLAQMDMVIEKLSKELEIVEKELKKEEKELKKSKERLKERRDWLKEQIRKMQESFK